ncbi:RidA family protein [Marisediminicola sp. LYQ134]|uniref:RidA family protein n=1 Tax=Marisediminicola sp. LYQ134 TaxID=3391061 RepID=UPI003983D9E4
MSDLITLIDPPELPQNPAFSSGAITRAGATLYVGGQNGIDSAGDLVDGIAAQTAQALRNVLSVLAAAGTGPEHVAKLTIYLAPGVDPSAGFAASRDVWGDNRTAITALSVHALALPGALVEIEAVAAIPE